MANGFQRIIRVRYAETDRMGRVYHGNIAAYLEESRVEMLRSVGWNYRELEEAGWMLPVLRLEVGFLRPIPYDAQVFIYTWLSAPPGIRLRFAYELEVDGERVGVAQTDLAFIHAESGLPRRPPSELLQALSSFVIV
jgi:acyl-CoA thioester hydrolase